MKLHLKVLGVTCVELFQDLLLFQPNRGIKPNSAAVNQQEAATIHDIFLVTVLLYLKEKYIRHLYFNNCRLILIYVFQVYNVVVYYDVVKSWNKNI